MLGSLHARVVDRELPVPYAAEAFSADGELIDEAVAEVVREILAELVATEQQSLVAAA